MPWETQSTGTEPFSVISLPGRAPNLILPLHGHCCPNLPLPLGGLLWPALCYLFLQIYTFNITHYFMPMTILLPNHQCVTFPRTDVYNSQWLNTQSFRFIDLIPNSEIKLLPICLVAFQRRDKPSMLCDEWDNACQSQLLRIWDHEDPHIVTGTLPSVWGGHKTEITVLLGAEKQLLVTCSSQHGTVFRSVLDTFLHSTSKQLCHE